MKSKTLIKKFGHVALRKKKIQSGYTLYLDIIVPGKERIREFLKLYLSKSANSKPNARDQINIKIATEIADKKNQELKKNDYNIKAKKITEPFLIPLYDKYLSSRSDLKPNSLKKWNNTRKKIIEFASEKIRLKDIDIEWLESFKIFLLENLSHNSAHAYFSTLKTFFNYLEKVDIIEVNITNKVKGISKQEPLPKFLTTSEIKMLYQSECSYPEIKKAFLFSCFTGVRLVDIRTISWSDIEKQDETYYIRLKQTKTQETVFIKINNQIVNLLDIGNNLQNKNKPIFELDMYDTTINRELKRWAEKANLDKHISYHISRHTFATLLISNGTDLYTVSKLLGHKDIRVTQRYANVVNKLKDEAIDALPSIL